MLSDSENLKAYKKNPSEDLRNKVVMEYAQLVRYAANSIYKKYSDYLYSYTIEDLEQIGYIHLMHAIEKYSYERDSNFKAYAQNYVYFKIRRSIASDTLITIPVRRYDEYLDCVKKELPFDKGIKYTNKNTYNNVVNAMSERGCLDDVVYEDEGFQNIETNADLDEVRDIIYEVFDGKEKEFLVFKYVILMGMSYSAVYRKFREYFPSEASVEYRVYRTRMLFRSKILRNTVYKKKFLYALRENGMLYENVCGWH